MSWRLLEKTFVNLHAGHVFVASFHEGEGMRRSWAAAAQNVKWASTAVKSFPNDERFGSTEHTKFKNAGSQMDFLNIQSNQVLIHH